MSANLDRICTVDITLSSPISNDANFDNILIIGPAPASPKGVVPAVGVYRSLEELTELGFTATGDGADPVGVGARVAFSQSPRPARSMSPASVRTRSTRSRRLRLYLIL